MKVRHLVVKQWDAGQSSNVAMVKYFPIVEHLDITFRNGATYRYFGVPASIYSNASQASSIGSYVSQSIKNDFKCEKQP